MEILSCSLLVCRALSAQWRSVGAVAPERVVASFFCSRLVSCTCALLWMFILTHATTLKPFHSKQSYPLHHLQHLSTFQQMWTSKGEYDDLARPSSIGSVSELTMLTCRIFKATVLFADRFSLLDSQGSYLVRFRILSPAMMNCFLLYCADFLSILFHCVKKIVESFCGTWPASMPARPPWPP